MICSGSWRPPAGPSPATTGFRSSAEPRHGWPRRQRRPPQNDELPQQQEQGHTRQSRLGRSLRKRSCITPGAAGPFGWRSRFLRARSGRMVVRGSEWRAAIWTSRRSTPASSMVVTNVCRSMCGCALAIHTEPAPARRGGPAGGDPPFMDTPGGCVIFGKPGQARGRCQPCIRGPGSRRSGARCSFL